ncbi:hypothetical protein LVJ94_09755 [Pendulispora rubella]|uniref:Uncharacterized protein n=1 Tax=Pendulispora rubella TaxID=2741070 RepID=A0ABZ2L9R9_9BACT
MPNSFRRNIVTALVLSSYLTTLAPSAFAQSGPAAQPGPDAVYLKDNNVLRGTLSEIVVGDHVTVMLTTGQSARILWSFVARIDHNGQPVDLSRAPQAPVPSATAPQVTTEPSGSVTVHIDGGDVAIEQMRGGWVAVCSTPCDRALPIGPSYRIVGDGVRASRAFMLGGQNGDRVVLDVDTASKGGFAGGIVLISLGSLFFVIGGFTLLVVALANAANTGNTGSAEAVGWTMFGGGAVGVLTGVLLMTSNSSTKVTQSLEPRKVSWLTGFDGKKAEGQPRLPTFREETAAAASLPKPMLVPIFGTTF